MRIAIALLLAIPVFGQLPKPGGGGGGGGGATIPATTSALKGDGAGNGAAVTGSGSNCVHVDGTSAACSGTAGASAALDNLSAVSINTSLLAQTGVDAGSTAKPFRDLFLFGSGTFGTTYFRLTGTTTGARVWTLPDSSDTFVGLTTTQTLTNKTMTSPVFTAPALGTPASGVLANVTGLPLATGVTGTLPVANGGTGVTGSTGSGSVVLNTSPTLVTPLLGTPASGVLTNATGLPISTGVSGLGTGAATFLATPSSANLAAAITDETGSGLAVFGTSPTLITPALGTPSSGVMTNVTGLPPAAVTSAQGNGTKFQLSTGTTTTNDCVKFDANGNTVDAGGACGTSSGGTGNAASNVTTTFSATPTFTCGSSSAGTTTLFTLSTALTASITASTLAACTAGQAIAFHFVQDATGGRTVAMPTGFDAITVDATASTATDAIYAYDGTNGRLLSVNGKATPFILGQAPERAAPTTATSCNTGFGCFWFDSTNHIPSFKDNNSSTVSSAVVPDTGATNNFLTAISASGVISKAQPTFSNLSGSATAAQIPAALSNSTSVNGTTIPASVTLGQTIASGTSSLGTSSIATAACATVVTTTATGTASTDAITWNPNGSIKAVTGYVPATTGGLTIAAYPTTNNVNFDVCNWTSGSITPGSVTINWRVVR